MVMSALLGGGVGGDPGFQGGRHHKVWNLRWQNQKGWVGVRGGPLSAPVRQEAGTPRSATNTCEGLGLFPPLQCGHPRKGPPWTVLPGSL